MDDSVQSICFPVWPLSETAVALLCKCLMAVLPYALRDSIIPLVRGEDIEDKEIDIVRKRFITQGCDRLKIIPFWSFLRTPVR